MTKERCYYSSDYFYLDADNIFQLVRRAKAARAKEWRNPIQWVVGTMYLKCLSDLGLFDEVDLNGTKKAGRTQPMVRPK